MKNAGKKTDKKPTKQTIGKSHKGFVLWGLITIYVLIAAVGYYLFVQPNTSSKVTGEPIPKPVSKIAKLNQAVQNKIDNTAKPKEPLKTASKAAQNQQPVQTGRQANIPILTYHYIEYNPNPKDTERDNLTVVPDKFDAQMGYLAKNGYSTISLDTMYAILKGNASMPPKPIILTFDDGYKDFYTIVYPILRKYNLHATSFIPTGLIGGSYYMNWSDIKEIDSSGLVSFQAHSVNHLSLPSLPQTRLDFEIKESKRVLETTLGKPVNFFAYPYGTSDARSWQAVKNAGFLGGIGTWYGASESEGVIYDMPRIKVSGAWSIEQYGKAI